MLTFEEISCTFILTLFNGKSCFKGLYCNIQSCVLFKSLVFTLLSEDLSLQGKIIGAFKCFPEDNVSYLSNARHITSQGQLMEE